MLWSSQSPAEPDLFSTRLNNGRMPGQSEVMQQAAPMLPGPTWTCTTSSVQAAGGGLAASPSISRVKGQWGDVCVRVWYVNKVFIWLIFVLHEKMPQPGGDLITSSSMLPVLVKAASCWQESGVIVSTCVRRRRGRLDWKLHLLWVFVLKQNKCTCWVRPHVKTLKFSWWKSSWDQAADLSLKTSTTKIRKKSHTKQLQLYFCPFRHYACKHGWTVYIQEPEVLSL